MEKKETSVGTLIRELRKSTGLSQRALAGLIGVSPNTVHQYETGLRQVRPAALDRIAQALNVDVAALLPKSRFSIVAHTVDPDDPAGSANMDALLEFDPEFQRLKKEFFRLNAAGRKVAEDSVRALAAMPQYQNRELIEYTKEDGQA